MPYKEFHYNIVIQILRAALACLLAGKRAIVLTLLPLFQFSFRVDGHAHRRTIAKRKR